MAALLAFELCFWVGKKKASIAVDTLPKSSKASLPLFRQHRNKAERVQQQSGHPGGEEEEVRKEGGRSASVTGHGNTAVCESNGLCVMMK